MPNLLLTFYHSVSLWKPGPNGVVRCYHRLRKRVWSVLVLMGAGIVPPHVVLGGRRGQFQDFTCWPLRDIPWMARQRIRAKRVTSWVRTLIVTLFRSPRFVPFCVFHLWIRRCCLSSCPAVVPQVLLSLSCDSWRQANTAQGAARACQNGDGGHLPTASARGGHPEQSIRPRRPPPRGASLDWLLEGVCMYV